MAPALKHRPARLNDAALLAEMNQQLIQDEGHRNRMTLPELERRMRGWLAGEYRATLFELAGEPVAYALHRAQEDCIYLRQFFVVRAHRRQGLGKRAMEILLMQVWSPRQRIVLDVLVGNSAGRAFWKALGFQVYCLTMERPPAKRRRHSKND